MKSQYFFSFLFFSFFFFFTLIQATFPLIFQIKKLWHIFYYESLWWSYLRQRFLIDLHGQHDGSCCAPVVVPTTEEGKRYRHFYTSDSRHMPRVRWEHRCHSNVCSLNSSSDFLESMLVAWQPCKPPQDSLNSLQPAKKKSHSDTSFRGSGGSFCHFWTGGC